VGAILLDDGFNELLGGGPASQEAHAALELGHEGHGVPDQVPPLDGRVPHLPTCKFPERKTTTVSPNVLSSTSYSTHKGAT